MTDRSPVQYILVRSDMWTADQMVQACHAASESIRVAPVDTRNTIRLLHVKDENELLELADILTKKNFDHTLIREPDEPFNGAATALATPPMTERVSAISKVFYHLEKATF